MIKQQKVQFFNSESSFGSESSLASSRYFDLTNQIAEQTQTIFLTLKRQFLPTQQLTNFDKIDYLHNRAKILSRDTIPDHLEYLHKISSPKESLEVCKQCERKLQKFIKDYESLKKGQMLHKQFYNQYGRSLENNVFFKKQNVSGYADALNPMMEPDVESINNQVKSTRFRGLNQQKVTARSMMNQVKSSNDRQILQLQEQITVIKKRESDLRKQFEYLLTTQKLNCQKRVNAFLKAIQQKNLNPYSVELDENYKNESIRLGEEITRVLKEKEELLDKNHRSEKIIKDLEYTVISLRDELAGYRKLELSRVEDEDQMNQSFQSQQNGGDDSRNTRRLQLQIKKLISQRDILKHQLSRQRQNLEKQKVHQHSDQAKQIIRLKGYLQSRNKQNEQLHRELDKTRVQLIQTRQQNKVLNKNMSTIKGNSQQLKKTLQGMDLTASGWDNGMMKPNNLITWKNSKGESRALEKSIVSQPNSFSEYQGEGIQGYPYFELLQKQFKIRFKRACLKNKELLYKSNGLEIGIITEYSAPNVVKILVHVTNSSDSDIKDIHVKAMNPNENKVQCEIQRIQKLLPNQQLKLPVICTIKNYPIGPVVFALDYLTDTKHDIRLLLPVHIFKCVLVQPRTQEFYKSNKISVKTQKKICKDINSLKEYLQCEQQSQVKLKIIHEHSGSTMFMSLTLKKDEVEIQYEHITGTQKFTEYFIKTFKSLLQKLN